MKYADVKAGLTFVENVDRAKHPKRVPRKLLVRTTTMYSAEVEVLAGRGTGQVLYMPLKRITDAAQWRPELPLY